MTDNSVCDDVPVHSTGDRDMRALTIKRRVFTMYQCIIWLIHVCSKGSSCCLSTEKLEFSVVKVYIVI